MSVTQKEALRNNLKQKFGNDPVFFIDVGANTGMFTSLCKEESNFSCLAIEPNSTLIEGLQGESVQVAHIALYDKKGKMKIVVPHNKAMSGVSTLGFNEEVVRNYMRAAGVGDNFHMIEIDIDTLDNVVAEHCPDKRIDAIKLDIEGAEYFALKGATETLKKYKPLLIFECCHQHTIKFDYEPDDVIGYLEENFGYTIKERWTSDVMLEVTKNA